MAYRAEIEVAVKGIKQLDKFQKRLNSVASKVDEINKKQITSFGEAVERSLKQLDVSQKTLVNLKNAVKEQGRLNQEKQIALNLSQRELNISKQQAAQRQRAGRGKQALSSAIIGGAFPLLFGQGAGAALGGGLGGAAGGALGGQFGFGLSLVGTALGQAVDNFIKNTENLAKSLGDPTEAIKAFEEAGFVFDDTVEITVNKLLDAGKAFEAQQVVLEEISKTLGSDAVGQLVAYDDELKKLQQTFGELSADLQAQLLPYLVGTISLINDLTKAFQAVMESPFVKGFIDLLSIIPSFAISRAQFEAVSQRGRELGQGRRPTLDPAVAEKASETRRQRELKHQKTLERIENQRNRDREKADRDAFKAAQDLLDIKIRSAEVDIKAARERQQQLKAQARVATDIRELGMQHKEIIREIMNIGLSREQQIRNELNSLDEIFEDERKILAIRESEEILNNKGREHFNLIIEKYKELNLILEDNKTKTEDTLRAELKRLSAARQLKTVTPVREAATESKGAVSSRKGELTRLSDISRFGSDTAAFMERVRTLVVDKGVSFNEAFELEKAIENQQRLADQVIRTEQLMESTSQRVGTALEDALVGTIEAALDGSKNLAESLQQIASDLLGDLGRMFIRAGIQSLGAGISLPGFAEGGFVTGPTRAIVGEGSSPEYIIPESKMRESMSRYSRGARGSSVIPQNGRAISANAGGAAVADKPIDVRYTVERINNVDYVTADQFQAGMRQATQQGAAQGESRALAKLRNSPGTRRRIGL